MECASSQSLNIKVYLIPLENTNHCIELNEGIYIVNEQDGTPSIKSKSFLDWAKMMYRESQFLFDLEQDRSEIIHNVKNFFFTYCKRTTQYLIKKPCYEK